MIGNRYEVEISLIVTDGENFKEIEEPSLTVLGDLDWDDLGQKLAKKTFAKDASSYERELAKE